MSFSEMTAYAVVFMIVTGVGFTITCFYCSGRKPRADAFRRRLPAPTPRANVPAQPVAANEVDHRDDNTHRRLSNLFEMLGENPSRPTPPAPVATPSNRAAGPSRLTSASRRQASRVFVPAPCRDILSEDPESADSATQAW